MTEGLQTSTWTGIVCPGAGLLLGGDSFSERTCESYVAAWHVLFYRLYGM